MGKNCETDEWAMERLPLVPLAVLMAANDSSERDIGKVSDTCNIQVNSGSTEPDGRVLYPEAGSAGARECVYYAPGAGHQNKKFATVI